MDKRETTEEIADFLKFNQADIYALGESSPEVAEAFSSVILAIDKKYGSGMLTNKDIKPVSSSTQQTAKQTAKIRFKTLKELNEEYSGNYPKPGWPTEMDSRAGTELSPKELKAMIEAFKINGMFVVEFDTYDNTADFEVAPWMLTNKPLGSFGVYAKEFSDAAQQRQPSEAVGLTLFSKKQGFIKIDSVTPRRGAKSFVIKGKQNATDLPAELVAPNAVMNKLLAGVKRYLDTLSKNCNRVR
jgi:hypothetical protein